MKKIKTPIWLLLTAAVVLTGLVYFGMVHPYLQIAAGVPIDTSRYPNPYIGEKVPPLTPYAAQWGAVSVAVVCTFIVLGIFCIFLGSIRAVNKLDSKHLFAISVFSIFFAFNTFSMIPTVAQSFSLEVLFYTHWITFFGYPIALLYYFYLHLRTSVQKWLWPVLPVFAIYGVMAWIFYFTLGLPLDFPDKLYTPVSIVGASLLLAAGVFWPKKSAAWHMRIISASWALFCVYVSVKVLLGYEFFVHNEFMTYLMLLAMFMLFYTLYVNTRKLTEYQADMRLSEMRNELLLENCQTLESHFTRVAEMKHEIRHHLFAIRVLHENGEQEQLAEYLSGIQDAYSGIGETVPCNNRVIQAMFTHVAERAKGLGFEIAFEIEPLPPIPVSDAELVSLFMNLLTNALESCAAIPEPDKRWIEVCLKLRLPFLYLSVFNARQGVLKKDGERYVSTKGDSLLHGHGMEIVQKIAKKYEGFVVYEDTEDTFRAEVALPAAN